MELGNTVSYLLDPILSLLFDLWQNGITHIVDNLTVLLKILIAYITSICLYFQVIVP
jgi:hypothetical protein